MALHKVETAETPYCKICGEPAAWYDKESHEVLVNHDNKEKGLNIGTGEGLVYMTCDAPECPNKGKPLCYGLNLRTQEDQMRSLVMRRIRSGGKVPIEKIEHQDAYREYLPHPYKGTTNCGQEGLHTNHMGNVKTFQVCRNPDCIKHFEEEGKKIGQRQEKI